MSCPGHRCALADADASPGNSIILTDIGLVVMGAILVYAGPKLVGWYYLIPYLVRILFRSAVTKR